MTERRAFTGILAVAALLRLIGSNAELWFDEIVTVEHFVGRPIADIASTYAFANNHVLNSLLAHISVEMFGGHPWALRLPAILFGVAGVGVFYFLARSLWEPAPALGGTLLFAVSFHHVHYSQSARGYTAFLFFAMAASALVLRLLAADNARRAALYGVAYAVSVALGLYALLLMVFVVAGHAMALVAWRRWHAAGWLAAGVGLAAVLYAPMWDGLASYFRTSATETGYPVLSLAFARTVAPVLVPAAVIALLAPFALRALGRRPLTAAILVAPLAFNVLLPIWRGQGVYPRTFIYALPLAYLVLIGALDRIRARSVSLAVAAAALVLVASVAPLPSYYRLPKQGFRAALQYIDAHRQPQDDRIGLALGGKAVRFYDPSVRLIDSDADLRRWLTEARRPAWVVATFVDDLESSAPRLHEWWLSATTPQAVFPGAVAGGEVHVRLWQPGPRGST